MSKRLIEESVKKRVKGEARKKVQTSATLNKEGEEILDPRPLFHDLGFKQPESINDKIRRITAQVQAETLAKFTAQNMTEEQVQRILDDEDDFDIPDEYDAHLTQYEAQGLVATLKEDAFLEIPDTHTAKPLFVPEGNAKQGNTDTPSGEEQPPTDA